jgi:hypothetical protein
MTGPIRRALQGSYLEGSVQPGLQAVPRDKRKHIAEDIRADFLDSIDLDEATRQRHPRDARWDYLLGHAASMQMVAVETHSAETSEVTTVIEKRAASLRHLRSELPAGQHVAAWFWAASGRVDFVPHEKAVLRLSQNGIQFVGGRVEAKHLASLAVSIPHARSARARRRPR